MNVRRYLLAAARAIVWMLQGRRPPPLRQPRIFAWARQTVLAVEHIFAAADAAGLKQTERKAIRVVVDKRSVSLEDALQTIRHHAASEYPYLLTHYDRFSLMTIQATNLNDQYLMTRLIELHQLPSELHSRLSRLSDHLGALPPADADPLGQS
jgi:hypothetical protein